MGTHVNGVDRTKDSKHVVIADDWGLVNLYKYPCLKVKKIINLGWKSKFI